MARDGRHHFLAVFLTGSAGLLLALCLIPTGQSPNLLGQPGSDISTIFYGGFGLLGWAFPVVFFLAAFALYKNEPLGKPGLKALGLGLGLASACSILHVLTPNVEMFSPSQMRDGVEWGGWLGAHLGGKLQSILTSFGTVMVGFLVLVLAAWFLEVEDLVLKAAQALLKAMARGAEWAKTHGFQALFNIYERFSKTIESWNARRSEKKVAEAARAKLKTERKAYDSVFSGNAGEQVPVPEVVFPQIKSEGVKKSPGVLKGPRRAKLDEGEDMVSAAMAEAQGSGGLTAHQKMEAMSIETGEDEPATKPAAAQAPERPKRQIRQWQMPAVHLLKTMEESTDKPFDNFEAVSRTIIETLNNFNVEAKVIGVNPGPTVTQYEVQPAAGVKINRISSLADDLALALQAGQVRIVAPIPGKAAVGIEVPNLKGRVVTLKELIAQDDFLSSPKKLLVALGKDISGVTCLANLKEMPHVLIAGSTGSGKSICMNTLVASLLFKASPEEVRLVLIDPKRVEMAVYKDLPHLALPVVTDPKEAHLALKWLVREMEERYELLARGGVRDIDSYNAKIRKGREEGTTEEHPMYYIVVLVDELADLMMVAKDQVEESIARLAQMARAVGIHLVLATQRPSVEVITGIIKANFPSRIAFQVFSKVDSRTVLDMNGAEALLGRGDMLYLPSGAPKPLRLQGAYVTLEEIERLVDFWKSQGKPNYTADLTTQKSKDVVSEQSEDELYDEAVQIILRSKQASTSLLQRRLKVGYSRAARLLDDMEMRGLIGPADGNKPRKILVPVPMDHSLEMEEEMEAMRKPTSSFLAFLVVFLCGLNGVFADAPPALTVDQIAQKVEDAQSAAQDVQMDLKMHMQDVLSGQSQEVQGLVKLKNPNLVYAHYSKPSEQFLYINGDLAQMYQPAQNTVYRQKSAPGAGAGPIYLGVGQELKRYIAVCKVSIVQDSGDQVVLLFIPKAQDASFDKMKVTIGKKDWWPTRMEVDTPSLVTRSEFSNFRFNQGVDSKLFEFTTPKGADVVEGAIF